MYNNYLVRKDSLENFVEDGKVAGFKFCIRQSNYRGCLLSLYNGVYCLMDGVDYPRSVQKFGINGKAPRTLEETMKCINEHWDFDDEGTVYVYKEGGLEPGSHELVYAQSILSSYGYERTDEEYIKNPPEPASGAGNGYNSGKITFQLELQA